MSSLLSSIENEQLSTSEPLLMRYFPNSEALKLSKKRIEMADFSADVIGVPNLINMISIVAIIAVKTHKIAMSSNC